MKNNSVIYKNPQEHHIFDLSKLGTLNNVNDKIKIHQDNHFFQIGDALFYDIKKQIFAKAVAINNIESEVCGLVSEVFDNNSFTIVNNGEIKTDRYNFDEGTVLYLSNVYPGKLVSIPPVDIIKQIAVKTINGIMIDIERGYKTTNISSPESLEPYTVEELNEIIKNIW